MKILRRILRLALALSAGVAGLRAQSDRFAAPSFRGQEGAFYAGWDDFTSATAPNIPDRPGSADGFAFTQLDPSAFITSSGNLYSFSAALSHRIDLPELAATPATVVLQTRSLGAAIVPESMRLEYFGDGVWIAPSAPVNELVFSEVIGTGFGAALDETRRWTWKLGAIGARRWRIAFQASGTSQSFQAAALDLAAPAPADAYQGWLSTRFSEVQLSDPLVGGSAADPDADGLPNLLEYALGGDPLDPLSAPVPACELPVGAALTLSFERVADPALVYTVEASDDLVAWEEVFVSTGAANAAGPVFVSDAVMHGAAHPRRFFRLLIARP